jgi:hypothetical protein
MNSTSISTRLEKAQTFVKEISTLQLLSVLFLGSLLLHLAVVRPFLNYPIALDDMFQYDMLARSLRAGNGFRWYSTADVEILRPYYAQFLDLDHLSFPDQGIPTTFRAPGYPVFLAILYLFVPDALRFGFTRLVQAGLIAALAPLTALLSLQIGFSRKVSLVSGIAISLYPILLFYPIGLASENLYIVLGLSSLVLILISSKKEGWKWLLLAGLLSGLTLLTRSIFTGAILLAGIWISRYHPYKKKAALIFLLTAFGICLPWSIRNSILMRQPAFVENSAGYNLFIGYHPEGDGGFVSRIAILPMNILDDGERDRYCRQQAIAFIQQNPVEAARRIWVRWVKFIGPEDREFFYFYSNNLVGPIASPGLVILYSLLIIPWGITLILGMKGITQVNEHPSRLLVVLFLLGYGLPHLLIIAEPRFHLAWVPILIPFAARGFEQPLKVQGWKVTHWKTILSYIAFILITSALIVGFLLNLAKLVALLSEGGNQLYFSY